jgi:hypothetical protein
MILKEFKEHAIELIGAVLLKWKYEPNKAIWESVTREDVIADATRLMEESLIGWDMTSDHVSKSELRAWCEENILSCKGMWASNEIEIFDKILEKFCAGER